MSQDGEVSSKWSPLEIDRCVGFVAMAGRCVGFIGPLSAIRHPKSSLVSVLTNTPAMNQTPLTPPVTRSTTVFRVTGIPLATTLDHLITILTTEFSSETDIRPDIDNCSLSPSCYDERNQTALIQFTPRAPRPLESLANNDDYLIDIGSGYDIAIDQDFYGLTQLYPTTEPITAE